MQRVCKFKVVHTFQLSLITLYGLAGHPVPPVVAINKPFIPHPVLTQHTHIHTPNHAFFMCDTGKQHACRRHFSAIQKRHSKLNQCQDLPTLTHAHTHTHTHKRPHTLTTLQCTGKQHAEGISLLSRKGAEKHCQLG